jgi:hypothetical protein
MRSVTLTVGGIPIGEGMTWAYPKGIDLGRFLIPIYRLTVSGTAYTGVPVTKIFQVFRFGVQSEDGKTARVVGLAEQQTHTIQGGYPITLFIVGKIVRRWYLVQNAPITVLGE